MTPYSSTSRSSTTGPGCTPRSASSARPKPKRGSKTRLRHDEVGCGSCRACGPRYARPAVPWKTLRVSHSSHSPDDDGLFLLSTRSRQVHGAQSRSRAGGGVMPVSVLILTLDEEHDLPACLGSVAWCDDVVVFDSCSTDSTCLLYTSDAADEEDS